VDLVRRIIEKLELTPARGFGSKGGDRPEVEKLAREFSRLLHDQIPDDDWPGLIRQNQKCKDTGFCVTQDHLDANMVMDEAFQNVTERECLMPSDVEAGECTQAEHDRDFDLWNKAWDLAKTNDFYHTD